MTIRVLDAKRQNFHTGAFVLKPFIPSFEYWLVHVWRLLFVGEKTISHYHYNNDHFFSYISAYDDKKSLSKRFLVRIFLFTVSLP